MLSTFRLYSYIKNPPKRAFTHKTENLPKIRITNYPLTKNGKIENFAYSETSTK